MAAMHAGGDGSLTVPGPAALKAIEFLLDGHIRAAEIVLRESLASEEFYLHHAKKLQIERTEQAFEKLARQKPWPRDFKPDDLIRWRGKLGGILTELPLAKVIEDLSGTAAGKQNLLYYLSAEKGKRASRWEILLMRYREEEYLKQKEQHRKEADEFWDGARGALRARPEWVTDLERRREMYEKLLTFPDLPQKKRREIQDQLDEIKEGLASHGY